MERKTVLIITYYWPPAASGGVTRWLKFVKYLRDFGWEPIIFTHKGGHMAPIDESLESDIPDEIKEVHLPIWEPMNLYKKLSGRTNNERVHSGFMIEDEYTPFIQKLSIWIRGNIFIPDSRKFWVKKSIKYLKIFLAKTPIEAVISSGPPHSMHMIALGIKKALPQLPWLADFRDPWTNIDFYDKLMLTKWADNLHRNMERQVLTTADHVVTVSGSWAKELEKIRGRPVQVINNGYDEEDFLDDDQPLSKEFSIVHLGSMNRDRNVPTLWSALRTMTLENPTFNKDLKIILVGNVAYDNILDIEKNGLKEHLEQKPFLPHHEALDLLSQSQLLLLPINNVKNRSGIIPGKLYEYLAARRPILCIGPPTGDATKIIQECKAGVIIDYHDAATLKTTLQRFYDRYRVNALSVKSTGIEKYSRKKLTAELAKALETMIPPA